jgi:hypothetical protein
MDKNFPMIKCRMASGILKSLLNLIPIAVIWLSAHSIYLASLAVNHYGRESGGALPTPAVLLINASKIYGPHILATLFTLALIVSQIKYPKYLHAIQVGSLCLMLFYASCAVVALMAPFICMCDAWRQW